MDAETKLITGLKASTAVSDIIGDRIAPMVMEQKVLPPAITYQRISTRPSNTLCSSCVPASIVRMQVDLWTTDFETAVRLFEAAQKALIGIGTTFVNRRDLKDTVSGYFRIISEFQIFQEAK